MNTRYSIPQNHITDVSEPKIDANRNGYTIVSHGGIGDEHGEYTDGKQLPHNLSGSCHEIMFHIGQKIFRILVDV